MPVSGELAVLSGEGRRVDSVNTGMSVGELGAMTGRVGTASVEAVKPSTVLVIRKADLDRALGDDVQMALVVQGNMIEILAERLVRGNVRIRDHVAEKTLHEARIQEARQKLDVTMDLLVERGASRSQVQVDIEDRLAAAPARILVVDDESHIRGALKRGLASFAVMEAGNGREALEIISNQTPDLVITDIKMPDMDGLTFLTHVRAYSQDVPVLAMSAYVDADVIDNYPFDGFIQKPAKLADIRQLVNQHLRKK